MGRTLLRLLPGAGGISRLHGQRVRRGERVYVPLYHPAAALYNATLMDTLEADMRRVREYLADAEAERSRHAATVPIGAATDDAASTDQLALFE